MNKFWHHLLFLAVLCAGVYSLYTDIKLQDTYPGDMRNRIVGSRLMKDGFSPYYYHWKQGDPIRYHEPETISIMSDLKISACTATPFLHLLLQPIADLPQFQLNTLWMAVQYLALLACLYFVCNSPPFSTSSDKILLSLTLVVFTFAMVGGFIPHQAKIIY